MALLLIVIGVFSIIWQMPLVTLGSVERGNGYQATTTNSISGQALERTLKAYPGEFAQLTITGAAAGSINFYDATTSDATARDVSQATTSILIASFPASTAAGTYTFDMTFFRGLLMIQEATAPTSTVTWR